MSSPRLRSFPRKPRWCDRANQRAFVRRHISWSKPDAPTAPDTISRLCLGLKAENLRLGGDLTSYVRTRQKQTIEDGTRRYTPRTPLSLVHHSIFSPCSAVVIRRQNPCDHVSFIQIRRPYMGRTAKMIWSVSISQGAVTDWGSSCISVVFSWDVYSWERGWSDIDASREQHGVGEEFLLVILDSAFESTLVLEYDTERGSR